MYSNRTPAGSLTHELIKKSVIFFLRVNFWIRVFRRSDIDYPLDAQTTDSNRHLANLSVDSHTSSFVVVFAPLRSRSRFRSRTLLVHCALSACLFYFDCSSGWTCSFVLVRESEIFNAVLSTFQQSVSTLPARSRQCKNCNRSHVHLKLCCIFSLSTGTYVMTKRRRKRWRLPARCP